MDKTGHFFYSEKQMKAKYDMAFFYGKVYKPNLCKLKDGIIREYTEWGNKDTPYSKWDDIIYLGEGEYYAE